MNWPSCAGWFNILAVTLNMLGVLTLFFFRKLDISGWVSRGSWQATVAENLSRVPKRRVGAALIGAGWAVQVVAQFFP
jgi:uncharacterized protein involved in cysteine biosynthesis